MKRPSDLLVLAAGSFLLALAVAHEPAPASDGGATITVTSDDAPLPPTAGCNPYIVVHPPELPPDASNMNGVTVQVTIGDVCRQWQAEPQIVPSVPTPRA